MKSAPSYTLPPDFDVEKFLDDVFPERVRDRFRKAEGSDCIEDDEIDAVIGRILAAEQARIRPLCRFCHLRSTLDCDTCRGSA
jgi:hypothetical protein